MNEQIKELALQAEAQYCDLSDASIFKRLGLTEAVVFKLTDLEAFAELIAAHEREACAKVCDGFYLSWIDIQMGEGASECAGAIRARGTT